MASGGRKPTALKLYEGEKRPERLNGAEAQPAKGIMRAPPELDAAERKIWDFVVGELQGIGVLTLIDKAMVARYCVLNVRWQQAEGAIKEHGPLVETRNADGDFMGLRANPAVAMAKDLAGMLVRLETEMGMTPASRTKIAVSPTDRGRANIERILKAK